MKAVVEKVQRTDAMTNKGNDVQRIRTSRKCGHIGHTRCHVFGLHAAVQMQLMSSVGHADVYTVGGGP